MRIAGFTLGGIVKVGIAAVLFIVAFKLIARRLGIPALQSIANTV